MARNLTETQRKVQVLKRRLAPIDYVIVIIAAPFAIWLLTEFARMAAAPVDWLSEQIAERPWQLLAFPVELFGAIANMIALRRIMPDRPNQVHWMGISSVSFEVMKHFEDYITMLILIFPLALLLIFDNFLVDLLFIATILSFWVILYLFLWLSGSRFKSGMYRDKILTPGLMVFVPGLGALSKILDPDIARFIIRLIDDFLPSLLRFT